MKKALVGLTLILGITSLIWFRDPLIQRGLCWAIPRFSEGFLGAQFQHGGVERQDGLLTFQKPSLRSSGPTEEPWDLAAEKATVSYGLRLWPMTLTLDIKVQEPRATFAQGTFRLMDLAPAKPLRSGFLKLDVHLAAFDGRMELTAEDAGKLPQQVLFTVNEWDLGNACGRMEVQFDDASTPGNRCQIQVLGDRRSGSASIRFEQLDMGEAYALARHWVKPCDAWRVSHGTVDGEVRLGWRDGHWYSNGEGLLSLSQVLFDVPSRAMNGRIGSAKLVMPAADRESGGSLLATLHLLDGSGLTLFRGTAPQTTLHDLLGEVSLREDTSLEFALRGMVHQNREPRKMRVNGTICLAAGESESLDLQIRASSEVRSEFLADLKYRHPSPETTDFKGMVTKLGEAEWTALAVLFGKKIPYLNEWQLKNGSIDGTFHFTAQGGKLDKAEIQNLFCRGMRMRHDGMALEASCDTLAGDLAFETDPLAIVVRPEGKISVADGSVIQAQNDGSVRKIDDVDAELNFVAGTLEKSAIRFSIGGLEGVIDMDWPASHEVLRAKVMGDAESVVALLPPSLKRAYGETLKAHQLTITASAARAEAGLAQVMGVLQVGDGRSEEQDILHFGFNLYKHESLATACAAANEFAAPVSPTLRRPEFVCAGLVMKDGWFWGRNLPLAKYASPLAAQVYPAKLQGLVDISGDFGAWEVACRFNGRQMELETTQMLLQMPQLGPMPDEARTDDDFLGEYRLDFLTGEPTVTVPLVQATVQYKPRNVWFTGLDALARMDGKGVAVDGIKTEAQGIRVEGSSYLSLANRERMELELRPRRVFGKLSNFQRLLTQLGEDTFSRLPFEGNVFSERENVIKLTLGAQDVKTDARFQGSIRSGTLATEIPGIRTKEIQTDFVYDHGARQLELTGLRGRILIGEGLTTDEYTLRGEHLRFYGFPNSQADFDFRVEGRTQELARLVGNTSRAKEFGSGAASVVFDAELTHVGATHPNVRHFVLKDWAEVLKFQAEPVADFAGLMQDLHRLAQPMEFLVAKASLESLLERDLGGRLIGQLQYRKGDAGLKFEARGDHVRVDNHHFASCLISAERYANRWVLEQLMLDDLSLSADVSLTEKGAFVAFAGARYKDSLLVGLEGNYDAASNRLEGFVNLLEVELAEVPYLFSVFKHWPATLAGRTRAIGPIALEFLTCAPYVRANSDLRLQAQEINMANWTALELEDVVCHLATEQGLTLYNLDLNLIPRTASLQNLRLKMDTLDFDFHSASTRIKGGEFRCPSQNLGWAAQNLKPYARGLVDQQLIEAVTTMKGAGDIAGHFEGEQSPTYHAFHLNLNQDNYTLLGATYHLRNVTVDKDPFQLKLNAVTQLGQATFNLELRTDAQGGNGGVLVVKDEPSPDSLDDNLEIHWRYQEGLGIDLTKAVGAVHGIDVSLTSLQGEATDESMSLGGRARINWKGLSRLLPKDLGTVIQQWQMGGGYELNGKWTFPRAKPTAFSFVGILGGRDVEWGGCEFNSVFAHVDYKPQCLELTSLKLVDPSGEWGSPNVAFNRNQLDIWEMDIPIVTATQIRPSLLRGLHRARRFPESLTITHAEAHHIKGILKKPNTYRAKGLFQFVNPSHSETAQATNADAPVTGAVDFDLRDGKICVTRATDLYSEGRRQQFLLQDDVPSYLTLDGRLFLNFRLAHRGLLFDEALPNQLTIRGLVSEPVAETFLNRELPSEEVVR